MNPSAEFVGWLIMGLGGIAGAALVVSKLMGRAESRAISPQPLRVTAEPELVHVPDCTRRYQELNDRIEAVEQRSNRDNGIIRADLAELRVNDKEAQRQLVSLVKITYKVAGKLGIVVEE